ncbi:MAG: hypothetical protein J6Q54_00410 [Oscillospiraceae bacterium]|nr:hypothetical protein [Oscillospiraceae bacterium]
MTKLHIDFEQQAGRIKPMHATGQPSFVGCPHGFNFTPMEKLQQAGVPYSRLHDVNGVFGGNRFVDIPNIFRDFDADETDPASYDFTFTDLLLEAMYRYELKPIFRLGVTIENQAKIKAYRIYPPKDFAKWARICEHIVRHYNEGWADGYRYGITYWEIWNEPDNGIDDYNQMWRGTPEQYFELYDITAKHLKACFGDTIKVGGYACTSFGGFRYCPERYGLNFPPREKTDRYESAMWRLQFFEDFWQYIKDHNSPIDFFSWHCYSDVDVAMQFAEFLELTKHKYGYDGLETHLNEWNNAHNKSLNGTSYASAAAAAMMCAMQNGPTDMLCYYDSRIFNSNYCGLFDPMTNTTVSTYYALAAFGELYKLGSQAKCEGMPEGVYGVAACDGDKRAVLIVNYTDTEKTLETELDGSFCAYLIDKEHHMVPADLQADKLTLGAYQTVLLKNY